MKKYIILFLASMAGVCFGVAISTHLLITGSLGSSWRAYVVQSGSMEPAIKTGAILLTKSASTYSAGDVITFSVNGNTDKLITHRIVEETQEGFVTKGDANEENDSWVVKDEEIIGKMAFNAPFVGYLANFVRTPKGFVALVVIPASIIIYEELKNIFKESLKMFKRNKKKDENESGGSGGNGAMKTSVLVPVAGFALLMVSASGAYFFDHEDSIQNVLGAAAIFDNQTPEPTPTGDPQPTPPPDLTGLVVINEVYYNPDSEHIQGNVSENNFEWVEIFNNSTVDINLKDWSIEDNSASDSISSSNRTLAAGEKVMLAKANNVRVVWGVDNSKFIAIGDTIGNGLANGGDRLILKDGDGNIIDQISYGSDDSILSPSIPSISEGNSIERSPAGFDTDSATDFVERVIPSPSI